VVPEPEPLIVEKAPIVKQKSKNKPQKMKKEEIKKQEPKTFTLDDIAYIQKKILKDFY